MKKLIITTIVCVLAAQLQADDYITVNVQVEQPHSYVQAASISPAQINAEYDKLEAARVARAATRGAEIEAEYDKLRAARVAAELKARRLEEYEKAKATVPAGYIIDEFNADGTITATKVR